MRQEKMTTKPNISERWAKFNEDEDGLEAIQVVMIVAIAAIVLIAVMTIGREVYEWLREKWDTLKEEDIG
jgi:Flp pilus assembly pilin Flp